jgi:hypothetical protein
VDGERAQLEPESEWRKDPTGRHQYRMWNGDWTDKVSDFGVRSDDPYSPSAAEKAATLDTILGPPPARTPRVHRRSPTSTAVKRMGGFAVVIGGLVAAIATFVPVFNDLEAFSVSYINLPDFGDDGTWVLVLALLVACAGLPIFRETSSRIPAIFALLLSTPLLVIVLRDWRDMNDVLNKFHAPGLGVASGLTICLIGAVLAVLGSVAALVGQRR